MSKLPFGNNPDLLYNILLHSIKEDGVDRPTRTGIASRSLFGRMMRFDIRDGRLPLYSIKKVFTKGIIHELLWMLSGDTNVRYLNENGVTIWNSWVKKGTEEYEPMSDEDIIAGLIKFYEEEGGYEKVDITLADAGTLEYTYFQEPRGEVEVHVTIDREHLRSVYTHLTGKEPVVLMGGELPKIYQHQWRRWEDTRVIDTADTIDYMKRGYSAVVHIDEYSTVMRREIDQIKNVIEGLKKDPYGRRHIVSAWNVAEIEEMALPPCHSLFQFYARPLSFIERLSTARRKFDPELPPKRLELTGQLVEHDLDAVSVLAVTLDEIATLAETSEDEAMHRLDALSIPRDALSCALYMRSNDTVLGNPFNVVQYSLLTHLVAQCVGMATDAFILFIGDAHIYHDQFEGLKEQFRRDPVHTNVPRVTLNPLIKDIFGFQAKDIQITGYESNPPIKFPPAAV